MGLPFPLAASGAPAELTAARLASALAMFTREIVPALPVADRAGILRRLATCLDDFGSRHGGSEAAGLLGAVGATLMRFE